MNCRGMASREKRVDPFRKWKKEQFDIILLQDTHLSATTVLQVKEEWEFKCINSTHSTHSRGTSILINNTFEYHIGQIKVDPGGNFVLVELKLSKDFVFLIGSIYGPNEDNPNFYRSLELDITNFGNPNIILAGDWNSTRDFHMDNNNYKHKNNPNASKALDDMIGKHNLIDIWRVKNPHTKRYTWLQGLSNRQARLDYYLCNEELLNISSNEDIGYKYRSDHSPITITIAINDQKRGPGGWKFNNSLLRDPTFIKTIKKEIQLFKEVHAATPYHPNYVIGMSKNVEYMANPHTLWETLHVTLRGTIIKYSKKVKRDKTNRTLELEQKISKLDKTITSGSANIENLEELRELNADLIEIRKEELKGALIRSMQNGWIWEKSLANFS